MIINSVFYNTLCIQYILTFRKYLTLIVSCIYAIFLVTLGLIIHVGDSFVDPPMSVVRYLAYLAYSILFNSFQNSN